MNKVFTLPSGESFKVSAIKNGVTKAFLGDYHQKYKIIIECGEVKHSFPFHDSIYHWRQGLGATEDMLKDALGCVLMDADCARNNPTLVQFWDEFGYDTAAEAKKCFNACCKTLEEVDELFSSEMLEEIYESGILE